MKLNELLERQNVAIYLAKRAGAIIKKGSANVKIDEKCSFADLVTESDKAVEKLVFEELLKKFPNDKFIGEESASNAEWTNEPTWVIDPIDGTTNFVHNFPFSCISIGFTFNREPYLGVVYNPHSDQLYTAIKNQGAQLITGDSQPISLKVRDCVSVDKALIVSELGSPRDEKKRECVFKNLEAIGWYCHGIRMLGSAALNICSVASGQMDAFFEFGPYIWDICAGYVILTEAGGFMCDTRGGKLDMLARRFICASSEKLAKEISDKLVVHLEFN